MNEIKIAEYNKNINTPGHLFYNIIHSRIKQEFFEAFRVREFKKWRLNNLRRIRDKRLKEEVNEKA